MLKKIKYTLYILVSINAKLFNDKKPETVQSRKNIVCMGLGGFWVCRI